MYILEEKFDQTAEALLEKMRQQGFARGEIKYVFNDRSRISGRLINEDINKYCPRLEAGVATAGNEYTLLYPYSETILDWMYQLAEAIAHCHQQKIVHGDIKLDNVGIKTTLQHDHQVMLNDFGTATLDFARHGGEKLSQRLGRVYTKEPTLFRKGSHPTYGSDAWAFGAILFYLCTGRYPFSREVAVDSSNEEKRKEYLDYVHYLIKEDKWKETLQHNLEQYLPYGFEVRYEAYEEEYDRPTIRKARNYVRVRDQLERILYTCFFDFEQPGNKLLGFADSQGVLFFFRHLLEDIKSFNQDCVRA